MSKPVVTLTPNETLRAAAKKMVQHGIGAVVVLDGKKPVGTVTERDIKAVDRSERHNEETSQVNDVDRWSRRHRACPFNKLLS